MSARRGITHFAARSEAAPRARAGAYIVRVKRSLCHRVAQHPKLLWAQVRKDGDSSQALFELLADPRHHVEEIRIAIGGC
eukprot:7379760-Prymnesium_polylepis.6